MLPLTLLLLVLHTLPMLHTYCSGQEVGGSKVGLSVT